MIFRFISLFCTVLVCHVASWAYQVKAVTADTVGEPLPYVTYYIYKDAEVKPLVSNVSDLDGEIDATVSEPGEYRMKLSYTGMAETERAFNVANPVTDLGRIVLSPAPEMLAGVSVTAQRPLVTRLIDRVNYDVQADPETPTATVSDILRKVPMVSVDPDGTIKVNGSSDFKIYKNGRPNNSLSRNAKDLLASLPASSIRRIEVITDPGAEFDAEGSTAVLNIVTESNSSLRGVMGNVSVRYASQENRPNVNAFVTTEIGKLTLNVSGGWHAMNQSKRDPRISTDYTYSDGMRRISEASMGMKGNLGYFGVEGSYQLDSLNLITAEANGFMYGARQTGAGMSKTFGSDGTLLGSYAYHAQDPHNGYTDVDADINYQHRTHRPGETYTISYMLSHTNQRSDEEYEYDDFFGIGTMPYTSRLGKDRMKFYEHTVQADWKRLWGIHTFDLGLKGIFRLNHSNTDYTYLLGQLETLDATEFKHNTDIAAAYAQYAANVGRWGFRAGLRYEWSYLKASYPDGSQPSFGSHFNDLVPSAGINFRGSDASSFTFNFSTSIARPGISYLNPAVNETPSAVSYGNPDLGSATRRSLKLTYMLVKPKINMQLSAGYAWCGNGVSAIQTSEADRTITTYGNVGRTRTVNLGLNAQWSPTAKTMVMINGGVDYRYFAQMGYSQGRWSPRAFGQVRQQLPWKLNASLHFFYFNYSADGVYSYMDQGFMSSMWYGLSLNRNFLKQDRLQVSVSIDQPFGPSRKAMTQRVFQGEYTGSTVTSFKMAHEFSISVSYRFGSLNAFVKKTDTTITNDDLEGRKNSNQTSTPSTSAM